MKKFIVPIIISISIIIGFSIFGYFYYVVQTQAQQSEERLNQAKLEQEKELREKEIEAEASTAAKEAQSELEKACLEDGKQYSSLFRRCM